MLPFLTPSSNCMGKQSLVVLPERADGGGKRAVASEAKVISTSSRLSKGDLSILTHGRVETCAP